MSRTAGLLLLGLMLSLAWTGSARAASRSVPQRVMLDYRRLAGAERCPSRAELEVQVTDILGRHPFVQHGPRTARCTLRGEKGTFTARVEILDTRSGRMLGIRQLSASSCEELGGAVALGIALAIDPLARPPPVASRGVPGVAGSVASPSAVAAPSTTPRPSPPPSGTPTTPRDAGAPHGSLGLPAAALALAADAGLVTAARPDAGMAPLDAGTSAPDAGSLPRGLGLPAVAVALGVDAGLLAPGRPDARAPLDAGTQVLDAGPGAPAVDAGLPPVVAEPVVTAAEPASPSVPGTAWRPVVGVGAVVALGTLPGVAGGVLVHAGAASSFASVELEARWLPGTSLSYGGGSISTSMVSGALVGCARFGPWAACGLTQAGPLQAQGQGYSRSEDASAWLVSVGARGQWEWTFAGPIGLRLHLDAMVNVVRPRLLVDSQAAWTTPPVSVWVGGGLFGRF